MPGRAGDADVRTAGCTGLGGESGVHWGVGTGRYTPRVNSGWWAAAPRPRELSSVLCDDLRGGKRGQGDRLKRAGVSVAAWRVPAVAEQRPTRHCQ